MRKTWFKNRSTLAVGSVILLLIFLGVAFVAYIFYSTPGVIRNPYLQHYHFRMQIIVDGQKVNLASNKFQSPEPKTSCTAALPDDPIHLHDGKDQIVHIHWDGITGGMVLKYYGWNDVGGINGSLGYRFDKLPRLVSVPIHGNVLPPPASGDHLYIYSGDAEHYKQRNSQDFLHQDLEKFFNHPSNLRASKPISILDKLFPTASARSVDLEQLNNLIGNVVIFAAKQPPSGAQITDRFAHLEPLSASVCGG